MQPFLILAEQGGDMAVVNTAEMAATSGGLVVPRLAGLPVPRQQFFELAGRVPRDPPQHIGQPGLRVHIVEFGGDDERVHRRRPLSA